MKEKWILINKKTGRYITYNLNTFDTFKTNCKALMNLNQDNIYEIEYWIDDNNLDETVKISDYFSL